MSKYTTQVRFICESKSGSETSKGGNDVDSILESSWSKIFTSKVSFFDEEYRSILCKKILKHYYMREICCETVGLWILWLNTRLEEIMPYYNQLYESAKIEFNPMHDVDVTTTHSGKGTENGNGSRDNTSNAISNSNSNRKEKYSDTPQGGLSGVESGTYLTSATINENSDSGNTSITDNETTSKNVNTTEEYTESIIGKNGGENFSSMLTKFRETFLNIDMQVINEFDDLFFGLW